MGEIGRLDAWGLRNRETDGEIGREATIIISIGDGGDAADSDA